MAIIKPEQLSSGPYNISGSFSGSFQGDGSGLINIPTQSFETGSFVTTSSFNTFTGSYNTGSFSGSFEGTSSYALTASYAVSASYEINYETSSSYAETASVAISASYAETASFVQNAQTASYVLNAVSSSYALSASFAPSTPAFPFTGSALITGSLGVTGSASILAFTSSNAAIFNVRNSAGNKNIVEIRGDGETRWPGLTVVGNYVAIKNYTSYDANIDLMSGDGVKAQIFHDVNSNANINRGLNLWNPGIVGSATAKINNLVKSGLQAYGEGYGFNWAFTSNASGIYTQAERAMWLTHRNSLVLYTGSSSPTDAFSEKGGAFEIYASSSTATGGVAAHFNTNASTTIWLGNQSLLYNITASSITSSFTGSLLGTSSYATQALSASYAPTIGSNLGQILFVSTTGNNSTAQIGDISKTYLTIESALSASTSGDVIHVFQGTYTLTTTASAGIAKDGISYYFEPGCIINKATSGSIFNITGFTTGFNVFGYGTFNKTTTVGPILTSVTNAFDFSFEALDISSTIDKCFSLSLNAKTATIKFRHAISSAGTVFTFPGVYFNGDNYDITATSITSTSTNAIVFSQGIGRINLKADLVRSTTSVAISGVYYTIANFNINYCLGVTYGYYIYGISPTTITGYTTGIYNANLVSTTFNGTAGNLLNTSGTFTGGLIITPTINGGAATFTWFNDYYNTLTVSAGIAYVTAAHNNSYSAPVNVTGGKLYLTGNINGGVNANYSTFTVNGATAELIFNGNYMFASGNKYQSPVYAFHLINGILRLTGNVENKIVNSSLATCVLYQSGSLILDGVSLRTINPEVPPIIVSTGARNLRTYAGGMSTNRTENGGTLAAKSKKYKYTVTAVASTSITLNDGSGGNEVFTETNTAVYNTTALLAQRMVALINASATLDITATQDTPGTDIYFYTTADVAGIPFTTPAYTNLTELGIRENSYPLTELIGGTIIENSNII